MTKFDDAFVLIGVDPGPTTGIIGMRWGPDARYKPSILHADADAVLFIVRALTGRSYAPGPDCRVLVAFEEFVDGNRHDHSASARATRDVIREIEENVPEMCVRVIGHQAAHHKKWEDRGKRLRAAGLWEPTEGWRHARSAASVALYAAVSHGYRPDPLSADSSHDWF